MTSTTINQILKALDKIIHSAAVYIKGEDGDPSDGIISLTSASASALPSAEYISPFDFDANFATSSTLTLTGIPETIDSYLQVAYVKVLNSVTKERAIYVNGSNAIMSYSSGTLSILSDMSLPFEHGQTYEVGIIAQKKAYLPTINSDSSFVRNPLQDNDTDIIHFISETNKAAGIYRVEFYSSNFNYRSIHVKCSGGVTVTIWTTNNADADTSSDTGWVDKSADIIDAASLVDDEDIFFIDSPTRPLKWMIKYVTSDATNAIDVWIRQHS